MSSIELDDAYERHEFLPLAVNWLGDWSPTTTYFTNDVVVSPINTASYIMIGPPTSIQGGQDPSINTTNWFQYGRSIDTVQNIRVGEGIELGGTDPNPIVTNTGIVSIVPGTGISNIGTAQDPVLSCETLTAIVPGVGIDVFGLPIPNIENTGVTYIRKGAGLSLNYVNGIANFASTGLQSLGAAAPPIAGLTVSAGPIKTITNTGLLSVIHGTGIINDGTATEPELRNGGVITLTPLNPSMTVIPSGNVVKLGSNKPIKTLVWTPTITTQMTPNPVNGAIGTIPITQAPGLWADCLATGLPYSYGYFALNFPFTFLFAGLFVIASTIPLFMTLNDGVNSKSLKILFTLQVPQLPVQQGYNTIRFTLGTRLINLEALRASGFRVLTSIQFQTGSGFPLQIQSIGGPAYATFYPFVGILPP
jgi:hypothetical protein